MKTPFPCWRTTGVALALLLCAGVTWAQGGGFKGAPAAFNAECTSCHIGYAPALTGEVNWRGIMAGLDKHFGVDASIDDKARQTISAWLMAHASKDSRYAKSSADFRISTSAWFVRQHDEVGSKVWKRASIKSAANCGACHSGAARGDFDEDSVKIPQ